MAIEIKKVLTPKQEKAFVNFPFKLYKNTPNWVPALEADEYDSFSPKKNGAYEYCEAERFLAYKDGELAGRVAAIINHKANEKWGEENVRFGWLDFIEDEQVLKALLDTVEQWGRERSCTRCKGPWGFTDMDKEGLIVEGYEHLSPFTCLYNAPYYDTLLKKIGYNKDVDWIQQEIVFPEEKPEILTKANIILERYNLHMAKEKTMSALVKKYGREIFHTYNETFVPLTEFAPLNERQIDSVLASYGPILDPRFVALVLDSSDKPVAFAICVPSLSKAVKKSNGKLFPFGIFNILHALHKNDTLEALMIGILPEYQAKGLHVLLFNYIFDSGHEFGIKRMVCNPQLEHNHKVHALWKHFGPKPFMRRRAYVKEI